METGLAFNVRLAEACRATGSLVCVGLDPQPDRHPADVVDFCRRIIDATAAYAVAFKPNSAFFEARGLDGLAQLAAVIAHVPEGRIVILDAKRGDIGSTAAAYTRAAFQVLGAHAVTVNPYLGHDAVTPFLANPARGAFVLCHTSNPGATDFQTLDVGGHPVYLEVARQAMGWNVHENVGLVVGATYPAAMALVRQAAPELPFLAPGIGAQGGDVDMVLAVGLDAHGEGLIINSSRGIMYAENPGVAARNLRDDINTARSRRAT